MKSRIKTGTPDFLNVAPTGSKGESVPTREGKIRKRPPVFPLPTIDRDAVGNPSLQNEVFLTVSLS